MEKNSIIIGLLYVSGKCSQNTDPSLLGIVQGYCKPLTESKISVDGYIATTTINSINGVCD